MQRVNHLPRRVISIVLTIVMVASLFSGILPGLGVTAKAAANEIANDSLKISVGDLGQISTLNIVNNPRNRSNREINFVLPNDTRPQNGVQHQWMGEMIFSVRSSADGSFPRRQHRLCRGRHEQDPRSRRLDHRIQHRFR